MPGTAKEMEQEKALPHPLAIVTVAVKIGSGYCIAEMVF